MRLPHPAPLAGALLFVLAACTGSADPREATDAGYAALGRGDAEAALGHFVDALEVLGPGDVGYARARMGEVEAKAHVSPEAAAASFLAHAEAWPGQVTGEDHRRVGALLSSLGAYDEAVDVVHAGHLRFPEDEKLESTMNSLKAAAADRGDDSVFERIAGLGYGG